MATRYGIKPEKKKKWKKIANMSVNELQEYVDHLDQHSPGCSAQLKAIRRMEVYEIGTVSVSCL